MLESKRIRLSRTKTEYTRCSFSGVYDEDGDAILEGHIVPKRDTFRNLGPLLQRNGDIDKDVCHGIKEGWMKWRQASGILCDKKVAQKLKVGVMGSKARRQEIQCRQAGAPSYRISSRRQCTISVVPQTPSLNCRVTFSPHPPRSPQKAFRPPAPVLHYVRARARGRPVHFFHHPLLNFLAAHAAESMTDVVAAVADGRAAASMTDVVVAAVTDAGGKAAASMTDVVVAAAEGRAAGSGRKGRSPSSTPPCAACKLLRRRCTPTCVFAPYFPGGEPHRFASVHKVFGTSSARKIIQEVPVEHRGEAASSLVQEANARISDPIYGSVGAITSLQRQVESLQTQLALAQAETFRLRMAEACAAAGRSSSGGGSPSSMSDGKRTPDLHVSVDEACMMELEYAKLWY
ncbi:hypothetical protein QYE76_063234 [Lolium multiflorum]|uniref:LOB domain-containing protein n=1 Tax=Lolium multiflorum TaxID=4521 RepID=A0AAD8S544_LOLMU|nr:hypothetical protein QYE76_063234 [Lolium multiflorum]